jgi:hypothetical protein
VEIEHIASGCGDRVFKFSISRKGYISYSEIVFIFVTNLSVFVPG